MSSDSPIEASVILPTFNQAERLALTLAGFAAQSARPDRFELIIVDDGSRDDVKAAVDVARLACPVRVIRQDNAGRSKARNRGLREAAGRIVIFNDCDAVPCRDFIELHCRAHDTPDRAVVGSRHESITFWTPEMLAEGRDRIPPQSCGLDRLPSATLASETYRDRLAAARRGDSVAFATADDIRADPAVLEALRIRGPNPISPTFWESSLAWIHFVTRNASVPRALLDRVGHFDESFVGWGYEDTELGYRLSLAGGRFHYLDTAPNFHQYHERSGIPYGDMRENFRRFVAKHPTIEVVLHWRLMFSVMLGVESLPAALHDYLDLVTEAHTLAAQGSRLAADYLRLSRYLAGQYTHLADATPTAIRDSELGPLFVPEARLGAGRKPPG
jgi:glycosyltransferase involved in cell wall biosynthesis